MNYSFEDLMNIFNKLAKEQAEYQREKLERFKRAKLEEEINDLKNRLIAENESRKKESNATTTKNM